MKIAKMVIAVAAEQHDAFKYDSGYYHEAAEEFGGRMLYNSNDGQEANGWSFDPTVEYGFEDGSFLEVTCSGVTVR